MLSFKKLTKYAAISSLALGLVFGAGSISAFAETAEGTTTEGSGTEQTTTSNKPSIKIDYEKQTITIITKSNAEEEISDDELHYVYLGINKKGKAIKTYDRLPVEPLTNGSSTTEVWVLTKDDQTTQIFTTEEEANAAKDQNTGSTVEKVTKTTCNHGAVVSIAAYTNTNEYDIEVCTVNPKVAKDTDKVKAALAKQTKKLTVKFVPDKKTLTITADGTELTKDNATDKFEYKTLYADEWQSGDNFADEVESFTTYGATLVVRQTATKDNPYSKEVKVKIPKKANGPKIAVTPTKDTVTIPAKAEWRIVGNTKRTDATCEDSYVWTATVKDGKIQEWISVAAKTPLTLSQLQKQVTDAGAKVGSGENVVTPDILQEDVYVEVRTAATTKKMESKISYVELQGRAAAPTSNDYKIDFTQNAKTKAYTGFTITNNSQKAIVVKVGDSIDLSKDKVITIKPTKKATFKQSAAGDGSKLTLMFAGVAAKQDTPMSLASNSSTITINYPAEEGDEPTATAPGKLSGVSLAISGSDATLTMTKVADKMKYAWLVSETEITAPKANEELPTTATAITNASDLTTGVTATGGKDKWVVLYEYEEVEGKNIIKNYICLEGKEVTNLSVSGVSAAKLISATGAGSGKLYYVTSATSIDKPLYGSALPKGAAEFTNNAANTVELTAGQTVAVYEVVDDKVVGFGSATIS